MLNDAKEGGGRLSSHPHISPQRTPTQPQAACVSQAMSLQHSAAHGNDTHSTRFVPWDPP